jgi:hypothetical protein
MNTDVVVVHTKEVSITSPCINKKFVESGYGEWLRDEMKSSTSQMKFWVPEKE